VGLVQYAFLIVTLPLLATIHVPAPGEVTE
jgi:hypothetical protein